MREKFRNLQSCFSFFSKKLVDAPEVNSRGSAQKELIFCNFEITDPADININIAERKFSKNYALAEWLWYVSGDPDVKNIGKLASLWTRICDDKNQVESNYGFYLRPQWNWVKNELVNDSDTRRATFVINQPYHKIKNNLDYPCTQYLQFFIRDNKLHLGVSMRSNDLVFGLCNDVFTFCLFQQLMLNELKDAGLEIELGSYFHHAGSLHVYSRHYGMIEEISAKEYPPPELKLYLNENFTLNNCLNLPSADMEKKELLNYVSHAEKVLFND